MSAQDAFHMLGRHHVTAGKEVAHSRQVVYRELADEAEQAGRQPGHRDAGVADEPAEVGRRREAGRMDLQRGAGQQRTPQLKCRGVEGERRKPQYPVSRPDPGVVIKSMDQPDNAAVRSAHPFWGTGGSRREGDVGQPVRIGGSEGSGWDPGTAVRPRSVPGAYLRQAVQAPGRPVVPDHGRGAKYGNHLVYAVDEHLAFDTDIRGARPKHTEHRDHLGN